MEPKTVDTMQRRQLSVQYINEWVEPPELKIVPMFVQQLTIRFSNNNVNRINPK